MSDVKWIKLYVDMANNKKIKHIRSLPEGNNIVLIWVFLLTAAGEANRNGELWLTDTMPFTPQSLAIEFDFDINIIQLALKVLENFRMIAVYDDIILIKNWEEYQNIDGLQRIREQTRKRVADHRERKKLQSGDGNVTGNAAVTEGNGTDIDIELDKEKENNDYANMTEKEKIFAALKKVKDYPFDETADSEMLERLTERYPQIDLLKAIESWTISKLDVPLEKNSRPRGQINTWLDKAIEYKKYLKTGNVTSNIYTFKPTERLKNLKMQQAVSASAASGIS